MNIIGKSRIIKEQLVCKQELGVPVELQLYNEFSDGKTVSELMDIINDVEDLDILCVHAPLGVIPVVDVLNINVSIVRKQIEKTLELAGRISEVKQKIIKVVLHTSICYENSGAYTVLFMELVNLFAGYMYKYENLEVCFENLIPASEEYGKLVFRNANFDDVVKLAVQLNSYFKWQRFGTVLDTCHANVTLKTCEILGIKDKDYTCLEDFFKLYAETVKLLHLADFTNVGIRTEDHGILFTDEQRMYNVMQYYKKYNYDCDITIEIKEKNYNTSDNFKDNYKMLNKIMKQLQIKI